MWATVAQGNMGHLVGVALLRDVLDNIAQEDRHHMQDQIQIEAHIEAYEPTLEDTVLDKTVAALVGVTFRDLDKLYIEHRRNRGTSFPMVAVEVGVSHDCLPDNSKPLVADTD
jgi:hypothetical protein